MILDVVSDSFILRLIQYTHLSPSILFVVYKTPGLTPGRGQNIYNCDYNQPPPKGQVCDVDIKAWSPCTKENNYSYHKSSPCIFLKLNKIYDWIPEFYNSSQNLPQNMPESLKTYIAGIEKNERHKVGIVSLCDYSSFNNPLYFPDFLSA